MVSKNFIPTKLGAWQISGVLGQGGQAAVLQGSRKQLNGSVQRAAIKVIFIEDGQSHENLSLLQHENDVLLRLDNPHIARVLDGGFEELPGQTVVWMATEMVKGDDLAEEITKYGPLSKQQWLELAFDIFSALSAAHEAGVIHCDLKPANILRDSRKSVLVDFGYASYVRVTDPGDVGGSTPGYQAPEQLDDSFEVEDYEYPVDLFAAGVMLVYAGTGWLPWDLPLEYTAALKALRGKPTQDSYQRLLQAKRQMRANIQKQDPRVDGLDTEQKSLVKKLLSFEPSKRGTAAETLKKIQDLLPEGSSRKQANTEYAVRRATAPGSQVVKNEIASLGAKVLDSAKDYARANASKDKDFSIALSLSTWAGFLGIDRFYLGKYVTGAIKLYTIGGYGFWWYVDAMTIAKGLGTNARGEPLKNQPEDLVATEKKTRRTLKLVVLSVVLFLVGMAILGYATGEITMTEE